MSKVISIAVDPESPQTIAAALRQYRQCLADGSAFRFDGTLLLNIEFVHVCGRRLVLADAGAKQRLLEHALYACRRHDEDIRISEPVLFAAACNFPELQPELEYTAEALVAWSRNRNSLQDLKLDNVNSIGLEALYMLGLEHSDYAHYLTRFMIPNWDGDDNRWPLMLPARLVKYHGWNRDLIRAYVWSDSARLRVHFYLDCDACQMVPDLLEHLMAMPQDYEWFKAQLLERLGHSPILSSRYDTEHPVLSFFYSLGLWPVEAGRGRMHPWADESWQEQVKQQMLLGHCVGEEAGALLASAKEIYPRVNFTAIAQAWKETDRYQAWF